MSCTEIHSKTYKFTSYVNDNDINLNIPIAIVNVSIYSESTYRLTCEWREFVTVQSQAKFQKTGIKCLHF